LQRLEHRQNKALHPIAYAPFVPHLVAENMITLNSFVASLDNISDVNDHYAFIDRHAAAGDREALMEIFLELNKGGPHSRIPDWATGAVVERIIEALALTNGHDNAVVALELAGIAGTGVNRSSGQLRQVAVISKIVAAHSPEVIDTLLRKLSDLETTALMLHEAVVRGKLLPASPAGAEIQQRLAGAQHPLALLPLTLLDVEQDVMLPQYGIGSSGTSIPFGPIREQQAVNSGPLASALEATETTYPERSELISAAVMNWKDESNGKIEARTFRADLSNRSTLPAVLPTLGLKSAESTDEIHVRENAVVRDAFTVLFSAASSGGAYNSGKFAAYGRLLAWQSLAGLVGASVGVSVHDIAKSAHTCQWCLFDSPNEWYYQVAWDIGVACFNPAYREVAVLAATDTD
jgi:hypothetical protein